MTMTTKKDPAAAKTPPPGAAPATDAAASKKKDVLAGAEGVDAQEAKLAPKKEEPKRSAKG